MHRTNVNKSEAFGVDIGGVLIDRVNEDDETQTQGPSSYADAAQVEGAFGAVARLAQRRFRDRIWLVSRCDKPRELVLIKWLERHDFFGSTGIPSNQVLFCRERHEKAAICRKLGLTHFIDDRLEVLSHLVGMVPHLYLFQSRASDVDRFPQVLPHVRPISRWSELADMLERE